MRRKTKKAEPDKEEKGDKGPDRPAAAPDDFVARLVQDPSQPPQLQLLSGYLGASSEEGHVRLYTDEELSGYVEIALKDIRHTRELPPGRAPLGVSLVWVERGAGVFKGRAVQAARGGGMYPSAACITPLISRRIPCRPPTSPFLRQHYLDFLDREPPTRFCG